jgi:hypothetical protein
MLQQLHFVVLSLNCGVRAYVFVRVVARSFSVLRVVCLVGGEDDYTESGLQKGARITYSWFAARSLAPETCLLSHRCYVPLPSARSACVRVKRRARTQSYSNNRNRFSPADRRRKQAHNSPIKLPVMHLLDSMMSFQIQQTITRDATQINC